MDGLRTDFFFIFELSLHTYSDRAFGITFILIKEDHFNRILLRDGYPTILTGSDPSEHLCRILSLKMGPITYGPSSYI